jgi:hypothetical protein
MCLHIVVVLISSVFSNLDEARPGGGPFQPQVVSQMRLLAFRASLGRSIAYYTLKCKSGNTEFLGS